MASSATPEQLGLLWDRYVQVSKYYQVVKQVTDAAEIACQRAYDACEAAYAEEVTWALAVAHASQVFQAACDAAFLVENGISVGEPFSVMGRMEQP